LIGFFAQRVEIKEDSRQCAVGREKNFKMVIRVLNPQISKNTK
jgi:hypothetical protein